MHYTDQYRNLNNQEKAELWTKISAEISPAPKQSRFSIRYYASPIKSTHKSLFRDYVIAALCVLLISSTGSVAAAAENSLPNSILYPIKIHITEPIQTLTKTTPESKIHWNIEKTKRRMEETKELISTNALTQEIASDLAEKISEHTDAAGDLLSDLATTNSEQSLSLSASLIETIEKEKESLTQTVQQTNSVPSDSIASTSTVGLPNPSDQISETIESVLSPLDTVLFASNSAQNIAVAQAQIVASQPPTEALSLDTNKIPEISEDIKKTTIESAQYIIILQDIDSGLRKLINQEQSTKKEPASKVPETTLQKPDSIESTESTTEVIALPEKESSITEPVDEKVQMKDTLKITNEIRDELSTDSPSLNVSGSVDGVIKIEPALSTDPLKEYQELFVQLQKIESPNEADVARARLLRKDVYALLEKSEQSNKEQEVVTKDTPTLIDSILPTNTKSSTDIPALQSTEIPTVSEQIIITLPEGITKEQR